MLSAEELYGHPTWLNCITTFSATIADKAQLLKMIDVLCVLQEISANQDVEELMEAFSSVKLVSNIFHKVTIPKMFPVRTFETKINESSATIKPQDYI